MSLWTEFEFQRVALGTRLSDKTLEACRDVLIEGMSGVEVATKHKLFPAQISRSIGTLRDKQREMLVSADALMEGVARMKYTVEQLAKDAMGSKFNVTEAEPGKSYEGPILTGAHGFFVQQVGRSGILHDSGRLDKIPPHGLLLVIKYPANAHAGKASVNEKDRAPAPENKLAR
jgi:hypothetical protein